MFIINVPLLCHCNTMWYLLIKLVATSSDCSYESVHMFFPCFVMNVMNWFLSDLHSLTYPSDQLLWGLATVPLFSLIRCKTEVVHERWKAAVVGTREDEWPQLHHYALYSLHPFYCCCSLVLIQLPATPTVEYVWCETPVHFLCTETNKMPDSVSW